MFFITKINKNEKSLEKKLKISSRTEFNMRYHLKKGALIQYFFIRYIRTIFAINQFAIISNDLKILLQCARPETVTHTRIRPNLNCSIFTIIEFFNLENRIMHPRINVYMGMNE